MRNSRVTLKDIAAKTGYTINTVSRALKNKDDISLQTRQKIQEVAKEMGYIGDSIAGALRSGHSKTVAVILGDISNPHFAIIVREIETGLRRHHYSTFIINTDENPENEAEAIRLALSRMVDGIIICPTQQSDENLTFLINQNIPFVLIGRHFIGRDDCATSVVCDDFMGGRLATEHLLGLGHRNILFLNGPLFISSASERLAGYKEALISAGLAFDERMVREVPIVAGDCKHVIDEVVQDKIQFTAILAFSDLIAYEAMYALQLHGFQNPRDYAIVGFDNIQSKFLFPFPLTSIGSSKTTMARRAVNLLLEALNSNKPIVHQEIVLKARLIVRASSSYRVDSI
ncbi:MAG: HTH-type transcriptional regulator DegA [Spirochaetes bacterium ADurb.Bin110]|nr:MAG: HTH-type transcriptional regulator DegA [Spirochaetes bacterium ADurb.Bin110]